VNIGAKSLVLNMVNMAEKQAFILYPQGYLPDLLKWTNLKNLWTIRQCIPLLAKSGIALKPGVVSNWKWRFMGKTYPSMDYMSL
jgi:hypothetical protein